VIVVQAFWERRKGNGHSLERVGQKRKGQKKREEEEGFGVLIQKRGMGGWMRMLFLVTDGVLGSLEDRVFFCLAKNDGFDLKGLGDDDLDRLQVHRLMGCGAIIDRRSEGR
jgi:hypothetical protein